ncbi:hypothetical protein [Candidatus Phytoplasma melaleucae]|uniref:DUF1361 domain-containing protein n=1 Tax=Candidatus Phytoplasma melaleucae TaxID=2982630 RepID=A0ABT9DEY5_9MOLU|nr:hypothetical protein ['Melaleuca sp.' phytoplasma]MDO8168216.1 hypothetical protein ['Melaleuca sp.' phytoplasma]
MCIINKAHIKKIVLGANLIAISILLAQINANYSLIHNINKIPIMNSTLWVFWYLPLLFIGYLFELNYVLFLILTYFFIDCLLYSIIRYINTYEFLKTSLVSYHVSKQYVFLISNLLFGAFIPIISFAFAFILNYKFFNKKKVLYFFLLITTVQSFSRIINGYINYLEIIKKMIKNKMFQNEFIMILNSFMNKEKLIILLFWSLNIIPVVMSNLINCLIFLIMHKKIKNIYDEFAS